MSNIGLEMALRRVRHRARAHAGRRQVRDGGDAARGFSLGGEQSGHIIFSDYLFTGDGLATALGVLRVMAETGRTLADAGGASSSTYPQMLRQRARARAARLAGGAGDRRRHRARGIARSRGHGRLLVRYSGTEPLLRIMLEGPRSGTRSQAWAEEIADVVEARLTWSIECSPDHEQKARRMALCNDQALGQRQQGRHGAQLARRAVPSVVEAARSASTPARRASPCIRARIARHITLADVRRSLAACCAARGTRRVQHRGRSAAGPAGARARRPARPVHAGARRARRDHQSGRLAGHDHARTRCAASSTDLQSHGVRVSLFVDPELAAGRLGRRHGRRPRGALHGAVRARVRDRRCRRRRGASSSTPPPPGARTSAAWASTPATTSTSHNLPDLPQRAARRRGVDRPRADQPRDLRRSRSARCANISAVLEG